MKAPDKIYMVTFSANKVNGNNWGCWTDRESPGETYIRKDALLEWAKEHKLVIETHGDERDAYLRGVYSALNSLIHKLNIM